MGTIHQTATFVGVTPRELYDAFLDSRVHSAMTGGAARMSRRVDGAWTAWDRDLCGKNVKLVPGKRIVQSWRGGDFPEGHYSTATFILAKAGTGTRVTLHQTGVPDDLVANYTQGWRQFYWTPMKAYFRSRAGRATHESRRG